MKICKIKSIKKIENRKSYDISVRKNHNFFANRILVHNCTTMAMDYIHARSLDSRNHISRNWVKSLHASICMDIPENYRIVGENVFAKHSIAYNSLPSYFLVFGIYNNNNYCISWDDTVEFCELLGLTTVPVLYRGVWDEEKVKACYTGISVCDGYEDNPALDNDFLTKEEIEKLPLTIPAQEGYVVRISESFHYDNFQDNVRKMVRKHHVKTSDHWLSEAIVPNKLSGL